MMNTSMIHLQVHSALRFATDSSLLLQGSRIPDGVNSNDVYAFTLGVASKRVMVIIIGSSHVYFCEM
jgi:hypothetical protein